MLWLLCTAGTGFNVLGNPFQVYIPMNVSSIFGQFSCIAEPAALLSGDRALRSCPFVSCHQTDGFQATEKSSSLSKEGRTGREGFLVCGSFAKCAAKGRRCLLYWLLCVYHVY